MSEPLIVESDKWDEADDVALLTLQSGLDIQPWQVGFLRRLLAMPPGARVVYSSPRRR